MEILAIVLGLGLTSGLITRIIVDEYRKMKWRDMTSDNAERIVKISQKYRAKHEIDSKYGRIENFRRTTDWNRDKAILMLRLALTPKEIAQKKKDYDKAFKDSMANYEVMSKQWEDDTFARKKNLRDYANQYYPGYFGVSQEDMYGNRAPQEPQYSFDENDMFHGERIDIPMRACKILPRSFDIASETIIRELKEKKGGEQKVKKMPKLFRYSLYLSGVVLVWHVVNNVDGITGFVVHHVFNVK